MMMLRSTIVVLSAFAMIISRSLARETQYFYNSVTGEVRSSIISISISIALL